MERWRRVQAFVAASASLAVVSSAPRASAQLFSEGFSLSALEPAPAGDRFHVVTDASSHTDHKLRLLLFGDYAYGSSLTRETAAGEQVELAGGQVYLHGGVAFPITGWLLAHANVPFLVTQQSDLPDDVAPGAPALGDIRLGLRANVISAEARGFAFGPAVNVWLPTGSQDDLTGDGEARVEPRLAASGQAGAFVYAANVGYLIREDLDFASLEVGDAVTFGGAAGVRLFDDVLQIGPELWGGAQTSTNLPGAETTQLLGLLGAKVRVGDVVIGGGAGPGFTDAPGVSPRVVASIALAPETRVTATATVAGPPRDRDGDGVSDDVDDCPDVAGVASGLPDENGCPESAPTVQPAAEPGSPVDSDGDDIPDAEDACPDQLGDPSDDPARRGCPAPVGTDADDDGVLDADDACPKEPGEPNADQAKNGCPRPMEAQSSPAAVLEPRTVTFVGFHVFDDGSSRIFVKLTSPVPVRVTAAGDKTFDFRLEGARVVVRNNKNPLLTQHFESPVMSARVESADKQGVTLRVKLRHAVRPTHRLREHPDGSATLHIDVPPPPASGGGQAP